MELNYNRCGDCHIPDLKLPEEKRPIGKWGRLHRDYLKEHPPIQFNLLALSGNFHTYLVLLIWTNRHKIGWRGFLSK